MVVQNFSQIFLYFSHIRINILSIVRMNNEPVIIKKNLTTRGQESEQKTKKLTKLWKQKL